MRNGLVPAPEALAMVLDKAAPAQSEFVDLHSAHGRVLARDLKALRTQPPFNASAMDGYAVHQSDLSPLPARLKVIGHSVAGHPFCGQVGKGQAVRIFTGAPVPDDADTIIIQENTCLHGEDVEILKANKPGKFIRPAGLDFAMNDVLLNRGRLMDPQSIALAAAMNHATVEVWKKPVVAIIATGDELVLPGNPLQPGQIIASNSFAIAAIARNAGANVIDMGIARDSVEALLDVTQSAIAKGVDLIVTMGGASVGDHDLVLPAMEQKGFEFKFNKIAMRPGKPFLFATCGHNAGHGSKIIRLLGLAGNPVSSVVAARIFMHPLINALAGLPTQLAEPVPAIMGEDMHANDERQEYVRASATKDKNGNLVIHPFNEQDSSMLANLVRADCLLIRDINAPPARAGDICKVVMLR